MVFKPKEEKFTEFHNPKAFDKEDCLSCRVLGRQAPLPKHKHSWWIIFLILRRLNGLRLAGWLHVLLGHAAAAGVEACDWTQQVKVQIRVTAIGDCIFIGNLGGPRDLSNVHL